MNAYHQDFIIFRNFDQIESLTEIVSVLKSSNIPYKIENTSTNFDPSIVNGIKASYCLKLKAVDFELASKKIEESVLDSVNQIPHDYYLYSFTNEELIEIINKPDEWGRFDYVLAKDLLSIKGYEFSESEIKEKRNIRLNELSKPEDPSFYWILIGYGFALVGGIIGIVWGLFLMSHKKTLPNGTKVQGYSVSYQKHGLAIVILGITVILISVCLRLGII